MRSRGRRSDPERCRESQRPLLVDRHERNTHRNEQVAIPALIASASIKIAAPSMSTVASWEAFSVHPGTTEGALRLPRSRARRGRGSQAVTGIGASSSSIQSKAPDGVLRLLARAIGEPHDRERGLLTRAQVGLDLDATRLETDERKRDRAAEHPPDRTAQPVTTLCRLRHNRTTSKESRAIAAGGRFIRPRGQARTALFRSLRQHLGE